MVTPFDCLNAGEVFNNKFYFSADVYSGAGVKIYDDALWRVNSNGSTTVQYSCCPPPQSIHSDAEIEFLTANNDFLFFQGDGVLGGSDARQELFIMDKDERIRIIDIYPGRVTSVPQDLHIRNDQSLLFVTDGNLAPGVGLYLLKCPQ